MTRAFAKDSAFKALWPVRLLAVSAFFWSSYLCFRKKLPQQHMPLMISTGPAGSLGPDWTGIRDGGLSILSQAVTGRTRAYR